MEVTLHVGYFELQRFGRPRRRPDRGRRRDRLVRGGAHRRRSRLLREGRRRRERPNLPVLGVGAVGGFDPPAILQPGEYRHLALWHRLPARDRRAAGRGRRPAPDRPAGGRLSLRRERGRGQGAARGPGDPERHGRRHRLHGGRRAQGPVPLARYGRDRRRLVGPERRGLVRRVGPDAGLPQEGAQPRRHLYRRGGRGSGARGRPGRRREAGRRQPYRVRRAGRCGGRVRRTQAGGDGWRADPV